MSSNSLIPQVGTVARTSSRVGRFGRVGGLGAMASLSLAIGALGFSACGGAADSPPGDPAPGGTGGSIAVNVGSGGAAVSAGTGGAAALGTGGSISTTSGGQTGGSSASGGSSGTATATGGSAGGSVAGAGGAGPAVGPPVGPEPDLVTRMKCTGTTQITCNFGGTPGNYDVTVVLGGAAAGNTQVTAEMGRPMLPPIKTAAGETKRFTFTVNVREPEGQPVQAVPAGVPGLQVYFQGAAGGQAQLQSIGFAPAKSPIMIYIASDSTVCDQPTTPFMTAGFGGEAQAMPEFFDFPISIANYADSGESSGSFAGSGKLFGAITALLKPNDYVFIQFGHNDKTVTAAAYHDNMTRMVTGVKAKGGLPVILTPVARAQFSGTTVQPQHINSTGANLPMIARTVAAEQMIPVLDMTARTVEWLTQLGPTGWQPYHANGTDVTHTSPAGALVEAGFVADLIKQANIAGLVAHLR